MSNVGNKNMNTPADQNLSNVTVDHTTPPGGSPSTHSSSNSLRDAQIPATLSTISCKSEKLLLDFENLPRQHVHTLIPYNEIAQNIVRIFYETK